MAMSIRWAAIQTIPSVVGTVASAKASGTKVAISVPKMNRRTTIAIGMAISSPRIRSSLTIGCRSLLMAVWPVR